MKNFKILIVAIAAMITFQTANAQSNKSERSTGIKTQSIKVYGNCGMDKKRIEKAAYSAKGVQSALWSEDSQMLTLKYSISKNDVVDEVQKKVASAGNDTEKYSASDDVYESLPECCHYPRKKS